MMNFKKDNNNMMKNNLYWLNIILSNTKINIFDDINILYKKYNFKRDQIYFPSICKKFKIKKRELGSPFTQHNNNKILDGDYKYIKNYNEYFCRPFGGSHL